MAHPIVYATSLVLWLPLLAVGLAASRNAMTRLLCSGGLALGLVGLLLTLSRGAWLASVIAFALVGALALRCHLIDARRIRNIAAVIVMAGLVLGIAFGPRIYDRLTRSASGNVDVRFDLNQIALRMTADHPMFGVGLNNFVERMSAYDPKDVMEYFPAPAHNLYLLESAEAGVPALVLWLVLFGTILLGALHHLPRMNDPRLAWIVVGCVAGSIAFLVTQLADFSHRLEPLRSIVWFQIGLLFGALQENRARRVRPAMQVRREAAIA
jgi:O-antigen ligase